MEDQSVFDLISAEHYQSILLYCQVRLHDWFAAEDCTQEVFLKLYTKMNKLYLGDNIKGWLYATADRTIRNYQRKERNRRKHEAIGLEGTEKLPAPEPPPAEPEEDSHLAELLTPEEYSLLRLYYTSDKTEHAELAKRLGISMAALYQRISKIRKKVTKNYDPRND